MTGNRSRHQPIHQRYARWLLAAAAAVLALCLTAALWQTPPASATTFDPIIRDAEISHPSDVDSFVLFAIAGESYVLTLQRWTLRAGSLSVWKPAVGGSEARLAARPPAAGGPLVWTAPQSGAWRVRVSGVNGATGSYRLQIHANTDDIGADLSSARPAAFDSDGILIERSIIDQANDVDWFAFPVASGNRYRLWSVPGSIGGLRGALRPPSADSFVSLNRIGNVFGGLFEADQDGVAVLAVRAAAAFQVGSYAVGVTREGEQLEPEFTLPPRPTPELNVRTIEASVVKRGQERHAEFAFQGDWGPIQPDSGLRVWIDVDPGKSEEDEWDYLLRSNDGRRARLWSFAREAWIDSNDVHARGFDTLVMRWSGRTADERIRWQASVKRSDGSWALSRPQLLDLPHPQPALPTIWPARVRTGPENPRYQKELKAAGVIDGLERDALVVVLDPGHGVDSGGWDNGVREADSNLDFARRIEKLLEAKGITVALTRRAPGRTFLNLDYAFWRPDYQTRAELAHVAQADLFVSIHSNANYNLPIRGLEAWYMPRNNGDGENLRLSELLLDHVQRALSTYGYQTSTLVYNASCWEIVNDSCDPIYVLAPFLLIDADVARRWGLEPSALGLSEDPYGAASNNWLWRNDITVGEPPINLIDPETQSGPGRIIRGNLMPTVLLELLYVTHPAEARLLKDPAARQVIAQSVADGILDFLEVE